MKESGAEVEKIPCTKCPSSDAMQVYQERDGRFNAYCFSCGHYEDNPYHNQEERKQVTKTKEYDKISVKDIHDLPVRDLKDRGLRAETLALFGVKVGLSTSDRTTVAEHYYPITKEGFVSGYKKRTVEGKQFTSVGDCKNGDLFGQYQAERNSDKRKLFITEGELDAMSVYQVLVDKNKGTQWAENKPAVVSITKGASGADKELARHLDFLKQYDKIVLLFDSDEAGQEGLKKAIAVLPTEKIHTLRMSRKDPNDYLKQGKGPDLAKELSFNVMQYKPVTVVGVEDIIDKALIPPTMGMPWLWPTLNDHTYGRHTGNIYGVGAGVGVGKSTTWFAQVGYDMKHDLGKHGLFMFEEAPEDALNLLASQVYAKSFNDPTKTIEVEERRELLSKLTDHVYFCDHSHMLLGSKDSWSEIVQAIRHMAIVEECKHITLDPMTALTAQMSSTEANDFLNGALAQLASMSKQLDICIYYGSHLNKPLKGKPHEEGGRVQLDQFTGSKSMIRWSQYILGLERDSQDPDEEVANTTWMRLLKIRRRFKKEQCLFPIYYDHTDGSYLEISKDRAGVPPSERGKRENPRGGLGFNDDEDNF